MSIHLEVTDSRVPCPGGELFARSWRPMQNNHAPIVLFHDSLGCVDLWRQFPSALAEATSRTVIAYDRLGFGKSTERQSLPSVDFIREEALRIVHGVKGPTRLELFPDCGHVPHREKQEAVLQATANFLLDLVTAEHPRAS